jgi:macrolide transport system ATP-binding/permease protein
MIEISNIHKNYRMGQEEVRALAGVSLMIEPAEFVAIMGPSGSGKSTLMHILGLLDVPDEGSYRLFGSEVSQLSEDELAIFRRETIGFVFQQFHLLARTSALENVALPQLYSQRKMDLNKSRVHLNQVGLGSRLEHKPNELSGGQQQRVAIARSLINDPRILLADEPTGNLDSKSGKEIMGILEDLNRQGITVILVTHEETIANHAKRIIRMKDGLIFSDERRKEAAPPVSSPNVFQLQSDKGLRPLVREWVAHFNEGITALTANKVRSGLSMLGILIGVAAVIAMLALGRGAQKSIESQLASLGSNMLVLRPGAVKVAGVAMDAGATTRLTAEDAESLGQSFDEIKRIAPVVNGRGQATYHDKNWSTQIIGTTPSYAVMRAYEPAMGRFFTDEENRKRTRVAAIGLTVASQLFGEADPLGEYIKINKVPFQVIGVLPPKGNNGFRDNDDVIMIPQITAMKRLLGKLFVDEIDMEITNPDDLDMVSMEIQDLMAKRHRIPPSMTDPFQIRNMADIQAALSESSRTMGLLLASIAAISLLVGGIGIMNIMLVSVTERTREIGLRKAVGARRQDILSQFLIEAMVISSTGGLIGIGLGYLVTLCLSSFAHWVTSISLDAILLSTLFSISIGIVFGIWPAKKASELSPIQALRYE